MSLRAVRKGSPFCVQKIFCNIISSEAYIESSNINGGYDMERTELEKLMDRYKKEMLEFSRKNGGKNMNDARDSGTETLDEREQQLEDAVEGNKPFERDRSDPLPEIEPREKIVEPIKTDSEEKAVPVQTNVRMPQQSRAAQTVDVRERLRENCSRINGDSASTAEQKQRCRDINDFLAKNEESGTLRVETYAADRSFGVGSARVMIFLPLQSGNVTVYDGLTNIDGVSDSVRLPAPSREIGLSPQNGSNPVLPYSEYTIYVEHPDYVRAIFSSVPVFSGIESVQPVQMLAKSDGINEPEPIIVDETDRTTLQR